MASIKLAAFFLLLILLSGCITQEQENGEAITEIMIPGHGNIYRFSYDIRESLSIPSNDPDGIRGMVLNTTLFTIVFDGSSEEDNGYFRVALINIVSKMQTFFAYEGKLINYEVFYYDQQGWYNSLDEKINKPAFNGTVLWFIGPNTGAEETSVNVEENIIYIQGTGYENIVKAGDRFALIFMGVERVEE